MNNLQVIEQREILGQDFKIYGDFENPMFLAKDVAEWIDYAKREDGSYQVGQMLKSIEEDEKTLLNTHTVNNLNGGKSTTKISSQIGSGMWFLTEDGLYEVLMQSRKPIAKQFKKKVKEILKDIRKHGMYATSELLENPELLIQVATKYKEEKLKRIEAENKVKLQQPKVIFADAVSTSNTSILVGDLAKILKQNGVEIGAKRLFEYLRKHGYLIKRKGTDYNMPTQKSMELNLFEIKETAISHADGHTSISKTPKITGTGQVYFVNRFIKASNEVACTIE